MDLLEAHTAASDGLDRLIGRIGAADWNAPTPCTEWTVRDLLNHLVAEQLWVPVLLAGATIEDIGDRYDGDVLGDAPVGRWQVAATAAREALQRSGASEMDVHLSRGLTPATDYVWELALDLAVHGWDLARGLGTEMPIDPRLAEALLAVFDDRAQHWRKWGTFGTPVAVEPGVGPSAKLIALLGRQP